MALSRTFSNVYLEEDEKGIKESQREINQLIAAERSLLIDGGKPARIVVGGFSQGAVMALLSVLISREEDGVGIEAGFMLSGHLPLPTREDEVSLRVEASL